MTKRTALFALVCICVGAFAAGPSLAKAPTTKKRPASKIFGKRTKSEPRLAQRPRASAPTRQRGASVSSLGEPTHRVPDPAPLQRRSSRTSARQSVHGKLMESISTLERQESTSNEAILRRGSASSATSG